MNRPDLLDAAKKVVQGEREDTYGGPEDSFKLIAQYWSIYLGHDVGPADVALMMDLLKTARLQKAPDHVDSWIDKAGYVACGCEIATTLRPPGPVVCEPAVPGPPVHNKVRVSGVPYEIEIDDIEDSVRFGSWAPEEHF